MTEAAEIWISVLAGVLVCGLSAVAIHVLRSRLVSVLNRVQPELRAVALLFILVAPLLFGGVTSIVVAFSAHGILVDLVPHHCHVSVANCVAHEPTASTATLTALGCGLAAAVMIWIGLSFASRCRQSVGASRILAALSEPHTHRNMRLLRTDTVVALVTGLIRSRVYVSRGLCERLELDETELVALHERAHGRRFDNLSRFIAATFAVGQLRRTAQSLRGELALAQEQACDRITARRFGAIRTAETLIKVERLRAAHGAAVHCGSAYVDAPIARRVRALVAPDFLSNRRSYVVLSMILIGCIGAVFLGAEPLHHEIESALIHIEH